MNGSLLSLTSATMNEMGSQFGHVIHSMLTLLTLTLTLKGYIQRGPSKIPPMGMPSSTSPTQAWKNQIKSETPEFNKYRP